MLTVSSSLGRSSLQYSAGGRSQVASLVACTVLLLALVLGGRYFAVLPKAVLATIIFVNMSLIVIRNYDKFVGYWKSSKLDFSTWCLIFIFVLFFGTVNGFGIGMCILLLRKLFDFGIKHWRKRLHEMDDDNQVDKKVADEDEEMNEKTPEITSYKNVNEVSKND